MNKMKHVKASTEEVHKPKVQFDTFSNNFGKKLDNLYTFVQENQQLKKVKK